MAVLSLLAALPILLFAFRTAVAAWLAFPAPVLNPVPPSDDLRRLQTAASLAPGEAMYPFYLAQARLTELRQGWLSGGAAESGQEAAQAAEGALLLLPTNPYFHRLAGSIALDRALHPAAAEAEVEALARQAVLEMGRALVRNPFSPLLHQQVGLELLRGWEIVGRDGQELATSALLRAAELDPAFLHPTLENVWARLEPQSAEPLVDALTPDSARARLVLARFLEGRARLEEAIGGSLVEDLRSRALGEYRRALDLSNLDLEFVGHWTSAHSRLSPEGTDEFGAAAKELTADYPDRPEAWLALADARAAAGETDEEMQAVRRAVRLAAEVEGDVAIQALRRLADLLFERGMHGPALEAYERLAGHTPTDPYPLIRAAHCLDALGDEDEALGFYERAARVAPRSASVRETLATAYVARHEFLQAITQWQAILARNPGAIGPRIRIARAYVTLGIPERAIRYYSEALELDPENETLRREMNEVVRRLGGGAR